MTLESFPTIPGAKVCMPSWPVGPPTSSSCSLGSSPRTRACRNLWQRICLDTKSQVCELEGWKGINNGKLLDAIERAGFEGVPDKRKAYGS